MIKNITTIAKRSGLDLTLLLLFLAGLVKIKLMV